MLVEINEPAAFGLIKDQTISQLPPEAWSLAENMRVVDGGMEKLLGWESFSTPSVAPSFLLPLSTQSTHFWLYTSLTKAYGFDGTTHTEITRAAGDYTTSNGRDWNGTILGGIAILNNGADVPQYWATPSLATDLAALPNWDATKRAKVIRTLGPHLVAFNLTEGGTSFPHRVLWSHPADPGSVPTSWDETDSTVDAGEVDLPDVNSGVIADALPLQSTMFIYKEGSVWRMNFIGGRFVFEFKAFLENVGILAPRCVALVGDGKRHLFATQDDIVWHDGNRVESILAGRLKRTVFGELDSENFMNSFMFTNPAYNEVWFCYPTQGQTFPNKAVIWNYERGGAGVCTEAVDIVFRHAAVGALEDYDEATWEDGNETWEQEQGPWSEITRRKVVLADTANTKLYLMDKGLTRDGTAIVSRLQNESLALLGRKRDGGWIVDWETLKLVTKFIPKVVGGPVDVWVGSKMLIDGPITWRAQVSFNPASAIYANMPPISGRALAVAFTSDDAVSFRVDGYKYEVKKLGSY